MRTLLLITIILLPVMCWGQAKVNVNDLGKMTIRDSVRYREDTIQVIMLVADTLKRPTEHVGWTEIDPTVWWKPGYIIINFGKMWLYNWLEVEPPEPIFLDRRKQRLPEHIVVWMIKELNQSELLDR